MAETRLSRARKGLTAAGAAVALAFGGFMGAQEATAPQMTKEELHALLGERINPDGQVGMASRIYLGTFESVAYEIPDEKWTVEQLDKYLKRMDYLRDRVVDLRTARVEFEEAYADSVAQAGGQ